MRSHKDRSTVGLGRLRGRCLQTRLNDSEAGQAEPPGVKGPGAGGGGGFEGRGEAGGGVSAAKVCVSCSLPR